MAGSSWIKVQDAALKGPNWLEGGEQPNLKSTNHFTKLDQYDKWRKASFASSRFVGKPPMNNASIYDLYFTPQG